MEELKQEGLSEEEAKSHFIQSPKYIRGKNKWT